MKTAPMLFCAVACAFTFNSAYAGGDEGLYMRASIVKLTDQLHLAADMNWYPKITKTNDNATDTNASMVSVGVQYKF